MSAVPTKHKVYVTRDAAVTYVAEVDLPLEKIKKRCGKYGFKDEGLSLNWEQSNVSVYDDVQSYQVTVDKPITGPNGKTIPSEETVFEYDSYG